MLANGQKAKPIKKQLAKLFRGRRAVFSHGNVLLFCSESAEEPDSETVKIFCEFAQSLLCRGQSGKPTTVEKVDICS